MNQIIKNNLQQDLEAVFSKYVAEKEVGDIERLLYHYVPYVLFEIFKKENLTQYTHNLFVLGGIGLISLDQMCAKESVRKILPLFELIASNPEKFNRSFGDADSEIEILDNVQESFIPNHIKKIVHESEQEKFRQQTQTVTFTAHNYAGGGQGKFIFFQNKSRENYSIKLLLKGKEVFSVCFKKDFLLEGESIFIDDNSAKYNYENVYFINNMLCTLYYIYQEILSE